jgi:hypothetical protein
MGAGMGQIAGEKRMIQLSGNLGGIERSISTLLGFHDYVEHEQEVDQQLTALAKAMILPEARAQSSTS